MKIDDVETKKLKSRNRKQAEDEEWEDMDFDKDALYKELHEVGPFVKDVAGIVEPESMVKLK